MLALCIRFNLLGLVEALLVAFIPVRSCTLLLFFYVFFLLCYLLCILTLIVLSHIEYFSFFILTVLVYCWWNILRISPCEWMYPWCFPHLLGLLIDFLLSVVLHIYIGSAVVEVFSCPLTLGILLLSQSGVPRGLPMFYPSLGTMMRVQIRVGGREQGWSFVFFVCC